MINNFKIKFNDVINFLIIINSFGVLVLRLICLCQYDIKSIIARIKNSSSITVFVSRYKNCKV